ncbi:hypothetical protein A1O1_02414 [Capronia coronata CBS 617.96]|uniref:CASTOR ACT domain-containing protein n=1 Tax=Capronia coronata CBS 617.96 TaxID=1182541 RepID=W9YXM4_9EURO|nr:uncharacterized protein A1O1_02414 [Capronia coronata CBS 617.96]EXJ94021.1 hypothetical protein A1O1_02414 [Capronia coronata CBS 617.96]
MADSMNLITAQISFLEAQEWCEGRAYRTTNEEIRLTRFLDPQEPHLALIHIPIELYSLCLQPILRLLFGEDHDEDAAKISWTNRHDFLNVSITPVECSIICSRSLADRFVAPIAQVLNRLYASSSDKSDHKTEIQISAEDYIVIQVDGQGLDAGQRVLELTSPLAMAGISLFFITTYFSDYILVPFRQRRTVTKALQQRGFVFSHTADAFVSQLSPSSPSLPQTGRPDNSPKSPPLQDILTPLPTTPPAKDIPELQIRTFSKLKRNNISPLVDSSIRLANCAGSREYDQISDERLKNDLLQVLLATAAAPLPRSSDTGDITTSTKSGADVDVQAGGRYRLAETISTPETSAPEEGMGVGLTGTTMTTTIISTDENGKGNTNDTGNGHSIGTGSGPESDLDFGAKFLSLTITSGEPISVLLEHRLLDRLGGSLLGAKSEDDALVPITLDLRELPLEATGIVCGVAGRLAQGKMDDGSEGGLGGRSSPKMSDKSPGTGRTVDISPEESIEISFLSTARAGTVIVRESQLEKALDALDYGMKRVADGFTEVQP